MTSDASLTERKRQRARRRIVEAAAELFDEHGFDDVSVADIADRAEVGRTTFFRYFGDKQEVVFADEEDFVATLIAAHDHADIAAPTGLRDAIGQLRIVASELCTQASQDPVAYRRHFDLVDRHDVLRARDALKTQRLTERLAMLLQHRGADERVACLAAHVGMACFQSTRHRLGPDPAGLVAETNAAFEQVLALNAFAIVPSIPR